MDDGRQTALDLAWHIVGAEHRFQDFVVTGTFDLTPTPRPAELILRRTGAVTSDTAGDSSAWRPRRPTRWSR